MVSQAQGAGPNLAASEAKAAGAVEDAKVTAAAVKKSSEENVKFVPLAKGEASRAKVAAATAADALAESKAIVAATTKEANAAALAAAKADVLDHQQLIRAQKIVVEYQTRAQ